MSLGAVIEVMIGLVFTYLLLAIMVSGVQEIVAGKLQWRGKDLRQGIAGLLAGLDKNGKPHSTLFETVFGHALIADLSKKGLPSYVPARNFSLALFEALKQGGSGPLFSRIEQGVAALPSGTARQSLTAFLSEAKGDVDALQKRVEVWFDDGMDRLTGEYRRFSTYFTLLFGFALAVVLNVDSINLARSLWSDPALRAAVMASAEQYAQANKDGPPAVAADPKETLNRARCDLAVLGLPIGWRDTDAIARTCKEGSGPDLAKEAKTAYGLFEDRLFKKDGSGLWLFLGWAITALAVSFGAPFWFTALQKLLNMRNAGPKPPRSDSGEQGVRT